MTVREALNINKPPITLTTLMSPRQLVATWNRIPAFIKALLPAAIGAAMTALSLLITINDQLEAAYQQAIKIYNSIVKAAAAASAALAGQPTAAAEAPKAAAKQAKEAAIAQVKAAVGPLVDQLLNTQIPGTT